MKFRIISGGALLVAAMAIFAMISTVEYGYLKQDCAALSLPLAMQVSQCAGVER